MIVLGLLTLLLPKVLGNEVVEDGNCDGPPRDPKKTVRNCNYYCQKGRDWDNKYFPAGTKCQYQPGHMGTCMAQGDGSTGCQLDHDVSVRNPGPGVQKSTTEGLHITKPTKRRRKSSKKLKATKKPKSPKNATTKSKDKKKKKKKATTKMPEW